MAINDVSFSYGTPKLIKTSGNATDVEVIWSYGQSIILHEWVDGGFFSNYYYNMLMQGNTNV